MKILSRLLTLAIPLLVLAPLANAELEPLDRVVAIVDQGVVLQSEVDAMLRDIRRSAKAANQELPAESVLRTQVLDRLIEQNLQLQIAQRMGLRITDAQVDQTIRGIAEDDGKSVAEYREALEADGENFAQFRERVRDELLMGDVRRGAVQSRISVSPQEIDALVTQLKSETQASQEFHMGHILVEASGNDAESIEAAKQRATEVLNRLNDGADFKQLALSASSGPKALEGGDWGWMNINEMPTLFANAAAQAKTGEVIGPLRSSRGFHIVKVFEVRGAQKVEVTEYNSRHILLKPSIILTEEKAQQMLQEFRVEILANPERFAELAQEYSDDPGSAANGGSLGWSDPTVYVPEFQRELYSLKPGEVSEPFRSQFGWHLMQLIDKRVQDVTDDRMRARAHQLIFNRKFVEQQGLWLQELRSQAYIDIIEYSDES